MATNYSPKIVTDQLVLCLDPANSKCFNSGETVCRNLVTGNLVTGASGSPGSGTHTPNTSNFPSYNSVNGGVFDFAGGKGMNCEENLGSTSELTLIMCFYKNATVQQYIVDARNNGGSWFFANYNGKNINCHESLSYNFDATYNGGSTDFINQWIHMAITSDSSGSAIYLNGYEISSHPTYRNTYVASNSINENLGKNFRIGTRYTDSSKWTGFMGPIYAYKKRMTDNEIYQNFSALRGRYGI